MKIAVIHGSPTGRSSVTLHYVWFIQQRLPEHQFEVIDIGRGIRRLERDRQRFEAVVAAIAEADGVLWSFPVYTFLAPAAVVRFVELLFERVGEGAFEGKPATVLTTSEHFFDQTAHLYMEEVSEDLGMSVFKGFSAEMEEVLSTAGQHNLEGFARQFLRCVAEGTPQEVHHRRVTWTPSRYRPELTEPVDRHGARRITLITDLSEGDHNLASMIEVFCHHSTHPVDVLNLHEIGMKGGCMGCLQCVYDGTCVYKDGFAEAFDGRIRTADVLIFAGTIRRRYLSATFKAYFDRNFRNGHRPILHGKPMGWLISGPLRQLPNLRQIIEAKAEVQHSYRLGIVTDEYDDEGAISERIVAMTRDVDDWSEQAWIRPATFLGVGGRKVFRDLMWAMRGIVRADHAYCRREGLYDFPQRDLRRNVFNWFMAAMMSLPWTRRWAMDKINDLKLQAFRKFIEPPPDPTDDPGNSTA